METKILAKKLKEFRVLRGMSQEYLAEEARVGLRTIQRIENNESTPTGETVKRIANALEVEIGDLIGTHSITGDIKASIVLLKQQLSKTHVKSEIKTFEKFLKILNNIKEKELNPDQVSAIESYLKYLELEKVPSFSNELFKTKLVKFRKFLKNKLRFVPPNYYTTIAISFAIPFAIGFGVQSNISFTYKLIVFSIMLTLIVIGKVLDQKIRKQQRTLSF